MSDPQEAATPAGHELRQIPPWPPSPDATYMLTRMQCSCGWGTGAVKDVRGNPDLDRMRERAADHVAESALVAATPSDPHSAEAPVWRDAWRTFQDPYLGPDTEKFPSPFESFVAGYIAAVRSRDAEVAELKAKIAGLEVWPAHDHVWDFNGRCLGCASWEKCPEFGSASSPVEGRPHDN